jgi:hypothetical protein
MGIISFLSFGVLSNTNHGKSFVFIVIPGLKPRAMNIFSLEKYNPRVKTQGYEYFLSREMGVLLLFGGWLLLGWRWQTPWVKNLLGIRLHLYSVFGFAQTARVREVFPRVSISYQP